MAENNGDKAENKGDTDKAGQRIAAGSILGVGVGAAIGAGTGDLGTGIWIGAVIGVGAAFAWNVSAKS